MKATGIVRRLDQLGRITLPKELRRTLDIADRDPVEIYVEDDAIVLKKYVCVGDEIVCCCCHKEHTKMINAEHGKFFICPDCLDTFNAWK